MEKELDFETVVVGAAAWCYHGWTLLMAKEGVIRYTRNSILEGLQASILMDLGRLTNLGKMGEDKARDHG